MPSPEDENMPFPIGDFDTSSVLGEMSKYKWWIHAEGTIYFQVPPFQSLNGAQRAVGHHVLLVIRGTHLEGVNITYGKQLIVRYYFIKC